MSNQLNANSRKKIGEEFCPWSDEEENCDNNLYEEGNRKKIVIMKQTSIIHNAKV